MALNISKGNMYEFVTHTKNYVKGKCYHDCRYCYVKRWGELKPVRLDQKELKEDMGSGNVIFVGSSCDMFATDINLFWIDEIIQHCNKYDNTYLFQSKNTIRISHMMERFIFPKKTIVCTTIETNREYPTIMGNSPSPWDRVIGMNKIAEIDETIPRYVTIEPIMDFDLPEMVRLIELIRPNQVNIGADSGGNNLPEPTKEKLLQLIDELKKFTIIENKRNLNRILNGFEKPKEREPKF